MSAGTKSHENQTLDGRRTISSPKLDFEITLLCCKVMSMSMVARLAQPDIKESKAKREREQVRGKIPTNKTNDFQ